MNKGYKYFLFVAILLFGFNEAVPEERALDLVVNKTKNLLKNNSTANEKVLSKKTQEKVLEISVNENKCDWSNIHEYDVVLNCIKNDSIKKDSIEESLKNISQYSVKNIPYGSSEPYGSIEEYKLKGVGFDEGRLILVALGKEEGLKILSNKKKALTMGADNVEIEHKIKKDKKGVIYSEIFELNYPGGVTTLSLDKLPDGLLLKLEYSAD